MKKEFGIGDNAAYKLSKEIALRGDLEELVASLSVLIAHLDNYMQIKIHCSEILKDLIDSDIIDVSKYILNNTPEKIFEKPDRKYFKYKSKQNNAEILEEIM